MAWYIHPSKQLRDDELPPELVVTNRDGSIEQTYVPYNAIERLKAENTKLRELVRKYGEYTDQDRCEGCACKSRCNDGDVDECWQLTEIRELARELRIEVEE